VVSVEKEREGERRVEENERVVGWETPERMERRKEKGKKRTRMEKKAA
jgi:hypothetical protein